MFKQLLKQVDLEIGRAPISAERFSGEEWRSLVSRYLVDLMVFDDHIPALDIFLGTNIFAGSVMEPCFHSPGGSGICFYRIRPENSYYEKRNRSLPCPADPKGPSATGLEIEIGLHQGFENKKVNLPPKVVLHFQIWGYEERGAFKGLFEDYRRVISLLLNGLGLEFWTACSFPFIDSYRKRDIDGKLGKYFREEDPENCFSFEKELPENVNDREFARIFIVFAMLYNACSNRLIKRGDRDVILDHFLKIRQ